MINDAVVGSPLKKKIRNNISAIVRYTILIVVGIFMVYPLLWMFGASFKVNSEIFANPWIIPKEPIFTGFVKGWVTSTQYTFATYFKNTFGFVLPKVALTVVSCTFIGFGFARYNFPGKKILFGILMATILLPSTVLRVPQYLLFRDFGWLNTYLPLVIPSAFGQGFFIFMIIQFLRGIPGDMEEAATVDGCNSLQRLWYVVAPVLKPAIISAGLFDFMWTWNDFMGPLIYISSINKYPVSLAIRMSIDASSVVEWNKVLAMSVIALIPSITIFMSAQKYFIEGVTTTGIKG